MPGDSRAPRSTLDEIWILLGELLGKEPAVSGEAPELFGLRRRTRALLREVLRVFAGTAGAGDPLALPAPSPAAGPPTSSSPAAIAAPQDGPLATPAADESAVSPPAAVGASISTEVAGRARRFALTPQPSAVASADPAGDSSLDHPHPERPSDIPWGYGKDRITAMAVDPDRLFVYWEITDDAIERARSGLGDGGASSWPNLRVYDVSGRLFDGTNAHSYLDHRIARTDRQWFLFLGRPTASFVVEVGMKSLEGYFVRMARSGRVDMPRREPAPPGAIEWLTVTAAAGPIDPARGGAGGASPTGGAEFGSPPPNGDAALAQGEDGSSGGVGVAPGGALPGAGATIAARWVSGGGGGWLDWRWQELRPQRLTGWIPAREWRVPVLAGAWQAGPFSLPPSPPEVVEERSFASTRVVPSADGTRVVFGSWSVIIRGIGARVERRVLSVWQMARSVIASTAGGATPGVGAADGLTGQGGSERVWHGASEQRWMGGSEEWLLAASELRLGGASERWLAAASELRLGGASEWHAAGASELRLGGASQWPTTVACLDDDGDPSAQVAVPLAAYPTVNPVAGGR